MARPEVVWVSPALSAEPRSGGQLRSQRLLRALAEDADVDVVLVQNSDAGHLKSATGARSVSQFSRPSAPIRNRVRAVKNRLPLYCAQAWNPEAAAHVRSLAKEGTILVLDHLWMATYSLEANRCVLSVHNAEAELLGSLPLPNQLWRRLERRRDMEMTRALEIRMLARSNLETIAVSESDASMLGGSTIHVVPNGADLPSSVPHRPPGGTVLFVGALDWQPNEAAVKWWSEQVWPTLPVPRKLLTVVGRCNEVTRHRLGQLPGIDLVGEVESISPYLAQASVVAVPLQHGGGSRLKILESLAWRRPVVTTAKGAEGLPDSLAPYLEIENTPERFGKAVMRLLGATNGSPKPRLASRSVMKEFSWEHIGKEFSRIVLGNHDGH